MPSNRANREGQPALYCAETNDTAVTEMRPAVGLALSLAPLTLQRGVKVVDLVNGLRPANPFLAEPRYSRTPLFDDLAEAIALWADAMSTPIATRGDSEEYHPTQALAERARAQGWDGIRYKSALSQHGSNVVLFDPDSVVVGPSSLIRVREVIAHSSRTTTRSIFGSVLSLVGLRGAVRHERPDAEDRNLVQRTEHALAFALAAA